MIIYSSTKEDFNSAVIENRISDIILENMRLKKVAGGSDSEFRSWQNSLHFMRDVIDDPEIAGDVQVAIEYQIPKTSKRVDFMIAGADDKNRSNVIVVELKQWDKVEKVDDLMLHSVRAYTGGANRMVSHPSYQAYSYSVFIKNSSEQVQDENIGVVPCAYLHNYDPAYVGELKDPVYQTWVEEAPFFIRNEAMQLRRFIKKFVTRRSADGELLYKIDNGRIRPSKALQDCLVSLMHGNPEFMLLDDQIVAYDMCRKMMDQCRKDGKKRTIIIKGGPGTGKSVLAVNLLNHFITNGYNAAYCTKNSAPRQVYQRLLSQSDLKAQVNIQQLFRSPFHLCSAPMNGYDCLIVDEAHRLVKKMYGDWGGENQVKECINASLFTIFLLDEDQQITVKDIGSEEEIRRWAAQYGSHVICNEECVLTSQFRCNGSDMYIQLLNNILQRGEPVDIDLRELQFDIRVFDDPNELRDKLREINRINNKARMVAGYCYDWDVKNHRGDWDIYLENGFKAQWNLENDKVWAVNPESFEQVGCIHTAQGLEFDYVGVLIGKDLRFDEKAGKVITDRQQISKDDKSSGIRTADEKTAERLIKNTYRTLLTRGQKGCFIYCEDKALAEHIRGMLV